MKLLLNCLGYNRVFFSLIVLGVLSFIICKLDIDSHVPTIHVPMCIFSIYVFSKRVDSRICLPTICLFPGIGGLAVTWAWIGRRTAKVNRAYFFARSRRYWGMAMRFGIWSLNKQITCF